MMSLNGRNIVLKRLCNIAKHVTEIFPDDSNLECAF